MDEEENKLIGKLMISREYEGDNIYIEDEKGNSINLTDWITSVLDIDEEDFNAMNNKRIEISLNKLS